MDNRSFPFISIHFHSFPFISIIFFHIQPANLHHEIRLALSLQAFSFHGPDVLSWRQPGWATGQKKWPSDGATQGAAGWSQWWFSPVDPVNLVVSPMKVDFSHWLAGSCWAVITELSPSIHIHSGWPEGTFLMDTSGNGINWKGLACCKGLQQHVSALYEDGNGSSDVYLDIERRCQELSSLKPLRLRGWVEAIAGQQFRYVDTSCCGMADAQRFGQQGRDFPLREFFFVGSNHGDIVKSQKGVHNIHKSDHISYAPFILLSPHFLVGCLVHGGSGSEFELWVSIFRKYIPTKSVQSEFPKQLHPEIQSLSERHLRWSPRTFWWLARCLKVFFAMLNPNVWWLTFFPKLVSLDWFKGKS